MIAEPQKKISIRVEALSFLSNIDLADLCNITEQAVKAGGGFGWLSVPPRNILNKYPVSSSALYAKNIFNFVLNLFDKEKKEININLEDEIIAKTIIK